jgi:uncharacterized protein (TIGR03000 family)
MIGRSASPFSTNRRTGLGLGFGFGGGGGGFGFDDDPFGFVGSGAPGVVFGDDIFGGRRFGTPPPADAKLVNAFPATLTIQFPPTSQMWMGGKAVDLDEPDEHVLTSPPLKPGAEYTFEVKLRWSRDGKTYEANRNVTLAAGAKSRLLIVSGEEVKE